jgi:hypothetical protein
VCQCDNTRVPGEAETVVNVQRTCKVLRDCTEHMYQCDNTRMTGESRDCVQSTCVSVITHVCRVKQTVVSVQRTCKVLNQRLCTEHVCQCDNTRTPGVSRDCVKTV